MEEVTTKSYDRGGQERKKGLDTQRIQERNKALRHGERRKYLNRNMKGRTRLPTLAPAPI